MDDRFHWDGLGCLVALDRYGGLSQAAQHLGTSHQTLARHLKALEQSLGTRLIDTSGRTWRLTRKGQEIHALALRMEGVADEVLRLSRLETEDFSGRIGIASVSWGMDLIVAPALRELSQKHPDITFDLISDDGMQSVDAGEADMVLRFTASPPPDLIGKEIGPVDIGVYGMPQHVDALAKGHTRDVPVVRLAQGRAHLDPWSDLPEPPTRITTVNDLQTLLIAARNGMGVAVLPKAIAARVPQLACFEGMPLRSPNVAWILRHQHSRRSNTIRAVEAALYDTGRRVLSTAP